jgi:hypothetical protein
MENMKLTFQWVFACVKQVNMGSSAEHQGGILKCFLLLPSNAPGVTAEASHRIAVVALGDEAEPLSFYQPLRNGGDQPSQINTADVNDCNVRFHSDE